FAPLISRALPPHSPYIQSRARPCFLGPSFSATRSARNLSSSAPSPYLPRPTALQSASYRAAALWIFHARDRRTTAQTPPHHAPLSPAPSRRPPPHQQNAPL